MKWASITAALLPLVAASGFTRQEYASGEVMELMMAGKEVCSRQHIPHDQILIIPVCMGKATCRW